MHLIRVCVVGLSQRSKIDEIKLSHAQGGEADGFDFVGFDGGSLKDTINRHRPHVYLVFDSNMNPKWRHELLACPLSIRRQTIEVSESEPGSQIAEKIMACYLDFLNDDRFPDQPLVSVFTPAHNSGKIIYRPFNSLLEQTYPNWEWIIVDDSEGPQHTTQTCETQVSLKAMTDHDPRVQIHRANAHCGVIGEMKRRAAMLSHGQILVELDHDDELTPDALANCIAAFQAFPDAGFAYSDCCEIRDTDGMCRNYGDDWGLGYGPKMRVEKYKGREIGVIPAPPINSKTIRHIMSMPNHFRAWKRDAYLAAGGHSPHVHVCDDYELMLRTFLATKFVHVAKLGYIQYISGNETNTTFARFGEIHRLVKYFRRHYDRAIHNRIVDAFGNSDFCWNGEFGDLNRPSDKHAPSYNYVWTGADQKERSAVDYATEAVSVAHETMTKEISEPLQTPKDSRPRWPEVEWEKSTGMLNPRPKTTTDIPKDSPPKMNLGHQGPGWEEIIKSFPPGSPEHNAAVDALGRISRPKKHVAIAVEEWVDNEIFDGLLPAMPINYDANRKFIIVDNFYADPMAVRAFALKQQFHEAQSTPNKGLRTKKFLFHGLRDRIQQILGETIRFQTWESGDNANGCFQMTFAKSDHVYHCDSQAYAGAIYLTPDAYPGSGTSLIRSNETGLPHPAKEADILDALAWSTVARAANIFNRLVLWDGRHAHCAGEYFGDSLETGRLVQLFFFDVE